MDQVNQLQLPVYPELGEDRVQMRTDGIFRRARSSGGFPEGRAVGKRCRDRAFGGGERERAASSRIVPTANCSTASIITARSDLDCSNR
nr:MULTISPECIES: hypothetical protein [unclassified Sphingobium]